MLGKDVLVCGTLNLETMLPIGSFPLPYEPVHYRRFELSSNPSGLAEFTDLVQNIEQFYSLGILLGYQEVLFWCIERKQLNS